MSDLVHDGIPIAAVLYGVSLALSLGCLAAAVAVRRRGLLLMRLGREGSSEPSPDAGRRRRSWVRFSASGRAPSIAAAIASGALGFSVVGPVGGLAGALGGAAVIRSIVRARERKRQERFDAELREFVTALGAAVRAGLSVRRGLVEAVGDVGEPLRGPLESSLRNLEVGAPLAGVLRDIASGLDSTDARLVATVLDIHQRVGGDLPSLLDEVGVTIGRRIAARRQVRALTAQGRASGAVLAALPVVFVGLLTLGSGDGLGAFYRSGQGSVLLAAGLGLNMIGFAWIRRIVGTKEAPA